MLVPDSFIDLVQDRLLDSTVEWNKSIIPFTYTLKGEVNSGSDPETILNIAAGLIAKELNQHSRNYFLLGRNVEIYLLANRNELLVDFGLTTDYLATQI